MTSFCVQETIVIHHVHKSTETLLLSQTVHCRIFSAQNYKCRATIVYSLFSFTDVYIFYTLLQTRRITASSTTVRSLTELLNY